MINNPLYKQLEEILLDENYTVDQAQNLTVEQVKELLGLKTIPYTFFKNMRKAVVNKLREQDDNLNLKSLKEQIKPWLDTNFPDYKMERGKSENKPFIKLWLKGSPDGDSI